MTHKIFVFAALILGLTACKTEPVNPFKALDLMDNGVPITIMAPDSTQVTTDDLIVMQEVSIRKGDDYFVQIRYSDAAGSANVEAIKAEEVTDAKRDPFFAEIIQDDPAGFIYKTQLDSTRASYGFRYVKLQGDKEYRFRNGIIGAFSEEATRAMYEGVQQK